MTNVKGFPLSDTDQTETGKVLVRASEASRAMANSGSFEKKEELIARMNALKSDKRQLEAELSDNYSQRAYNLANTKIILRLGKGDESFKEWTKQQSKMDREKASIKKEISEIERQLATTKAQALEMEPEGANSLTVIGKMIVSRLDEILQILRKQDATN